MLFARRTWYNGENALRLNREGASNPERGYAMYSYEEFAEDLNMGHEAEFYFNGIHFLISYHENECYCIGDHGKTKHVYKSIQQLLSGYKIEGMILKDLWSRIVVTNIF